MTYSEVLGWMQEVTQEFKGGHFYTMDERSMIDAVGVENSRFKAVLSPLMHNAEIVSIELYRKDTSGEYLINQINEPAEYVQDELRKYFK